MIMINIDDELNIDMESLQRRPDWHYPSQIVNVVDDNTYWNLRRNLTKHLGHELTEISERLF